MALDECKLLLISSKGVWGSLTDVEKQDFIVSLLSNPPEHRLSKPIEELFDKITPDVGMINPGMIGIGNMTCIAISFN